MNGPAQSNLTSRVPDLLFNLARGMATAAAAPSCTAFSAADPADFAAACACVIACPIFSG